MDAAWVGVVGTLLGGVVGFGGQWIHAGRQRRWQRQDLAAQNALHRESDLRLLRLEQYEEFKRRSSRALIATMGRAAAAEAASQVPDTDPRKVAVLAEAVQAATASASAYGELMGTSSTLDLIAGPEVRQAAEVVVAWLTDALTRDQSEGWSDVLPVFSRPSSEHVRTPCGLS